MSASHTPPAPTSNGADPRCDRDEENRSEQEADENGKGRGRGRGVSGPGGEEGSRPQGEENDTTCADVSCEICHCPLADGSRTCLKCETDLYEPDLLRLNKRSDGNHDEERSELAQGERLLQSAGSGTYRVLRKDVMKREHTIELTLVGPDGPVHARYKVPFAQSASSGEPYGSYQRSAQGGECDEVPVRQYGVCATHEEVFDQARDPPDALTEERSDSALTFPSTSGSYRSISIASRAWDTTPSSTTPNSEIGWAERVWNDHRLSADGYINRLDECCVCGMRTWLEDAVHEDNQWRVRRRLRRRTVVIASVGVADVWFARAEDMQRIAKKGWIWLRLRVLARCAVEVPKETWLLIINFLLPLRGLAMSDLWKESGEEAGSEEEEGQSGG